MLARRRPLACFLLAALPAPASSSGTAGRRSLAQMPFLAQAGLRHKTGRGRRPHSWGGTTSHGGRALGARWLVRGGSSSRVKVQSGRPPGASMEATLSATEPLRRALPSSMGPRSNSASLAPAVGGGWWCGLGGGCNPILFRCRMLCRNADADALTPHGRPGGRPPGQAASRPPALPCTHLPASSGRPAARW